MNEPFKLFVTNYRTINSAPSAGESFDAIETDVDLTTISGLMVQFTGGQPNQAVLYSTPFAGANGASYNSGRLNTRNIVLTFSLLSNQGANRIRIYSLFRTGSKVRLKFHTQNNARKAYIEGFVETITENRFNAQRKEVIQVSIICFDPLFKALTANVNTVVGANIPTNWHVNYGGDVPNGVLVKMTFSGSVGDPGIMNRNDWRNGGLGGVKIYGTFASTDTVYIDTRQGQKAVYKIDGNNVKTNLLSKCLQPIDWFRAVVGDNDYYISATTGKNNLTVELQTVDVYEGI